MDKTPGQTRGSFSFASKSAEETLRLGAAIGSLLKADDAALLMGDLGAGKTTLVQGICRGAGMEEGSWARSPTFTLINEYEARTPIRHADLYRVDTWEEFSSIGLFDPSFNGITLVEWGEKLPAGMDFNPTLIIKLRETSETDREITIESSQSLIDSLLHLISNR